MCYLVALSIALGAVEGAIPVQLKLEVSSLEIDAGDPLVVKSILANRGRTSIQLGQPPSAHIGTVVFEWSVDRESWKAIPAIGQSAYEGYAGSPPIRPGESWVCYDVLFPDGEGWIRGRYRTATKSVGPSEAIFVRVNAAPPARTKFASEHRDTIRAAANLWSHTLDIGRVKALIEELDMCELRTFLSSRAFAEQFDGSAEEFLSRPIDASQFSGAKGVMSEMAIVCAARSSWLVHQKPKVSKKLMETLKGTRTVHFGGIQEDVQEALTTPAATP